MNGVEDPELSAYLRKLRWALAAVPDADRDSIVAETRSHILDRVEAGARLADALAALGPAEHYARDFRDSHALTTAISSRKLPQLLSALLLNAARSAVVAGAGAAILAAWSIAAVGVHLTLLKLGDPAHVGLWRGEHFFFIGIIDDPSTGTELLGLWLPAIALLVVVLAWALTHFLGVWALRRIKLRA